MAANILDPATHAPPMGRTRVQESDVRAWFVDDPRFKTSTTRSGIWDEYELARDVVRGAVRLHAVWFSGSFISDKVDPSDIDVTFVVSARDYDRASEDDKKVVDSFQLQPRPALGGARARTSGLALVDSFLLLWRPVPPQLAMEPIPASYFGFRGYWDDWWQRKATNPKGQPPHVDDPLPRRGYLEVEFDAFAR